MDANARARTVDFPPSAGYAGSFAMPEAAPPRLAKAASDDAAAAPQAATSYAATAASLATAASKVDYAPIGVGEVAATIAVVLAWRHLKGAGERMRAIAADGPARGSWVPDDDHAQRIAFEARYDRRNRR